MVTPIVAGGLIAGASLIGGALSKPSESESGIRRKKMRPLKTETEWITQRQKQNTQEYGQRMIENALRGRDSLMGLTKAGIAPKLSVVSQGYSNAASRLQGGLMAGSDILSGKTPDYSYMGARTITPDISYLTDYEPAEYDVSIPEEWEPAEEDVIEQEAQMRDISVKKYTKQLDKAAWEKETQAEAEAAGFDYKTYAKIKKKAEKKAEKKAKKIGKKAAKKAGKEAEKMVRETEKAERKAEKAGDKEVLANEIIAGGG